MGDYLFHDLSIRIEPEEVEARAQLRDLLPRLSVVPTTRRAGKARADISILLGEEQSDIPRLAKLKFEVDGFQGREDSRGFYLTDGGSIFHIPKGSTQGRAFLAPSFFGAPPIHQYNFWHFALLKLARSLGFYGLHAAGLEAEDGRGLLVIGRSGSGKSTLTLGLVRQGWNYLSDDAILLHAAPRGVRALTLRRHFYLDARARSKNADLPLGAVFESNCGGHKCRVEIENTSFHRQQLFQCIPTILLYTRIVPESHSTLVPLGQASALKHLLEGSGPQLFDRETMGGHFGLLRALLEQCRSYGLDAGRDLYGDSGILNRLLSEAVSKEAACHGSLSN